MKGELDPRVELLKQGLAWTSEKDPIPELESHRNEAQQKGKGLWKNDNPTPPWIFRRQQSMMQPKSS
jgi:endonuclease YncB( thermonuclease family)